MVEEAGRVEKSGLKRYSMIEVISSCDDDRLKSQLTPQQLVDKVHSDTLGAQVSTEISSYKQMVPHRHVNIRCAAYTEVNPWLLMDNTDCEKSFGCEKSVKNVNKVA